MKQQNCQELSMDIQMLLKIVKKTYYSLETFIIESSLVNTNSQLHRISEQNKYLLSISRKYRNLDTKQNEEILGKMKKKLKQWLLLHKTKYQNRLINKDIRHYFQQLQLTLKLYQKADNLAQFATKLYNIANQQLRVFKIKTDICSQTEDVGSLGPMNHLRRARSHTVKCSTVRSDQFRSINFAQIYNLEIDSNFLKGSIMILQKSPLDWFHSQLSRNKHIQECLENYHNLHFLHFQKKKKKELNNLILKSANQKNLRIKTTVHDKLYHNFNHQRSRRKVAKEKENQHSDTSKDTYQINSLYVSGNQFDIYGEKHQQWTRNSHEHKKCSLLMCRVFRQSLTTKNCNFQPRQLTRFIL